MRTGYFAASRSSAFALSDMWSAVLLTLMRAAPSCIPWLFLPAQKVKLILRHNFSDLWRSPVVLRSRLSLPHAESHMYLHASARSPVGERSLQSVAPARTYLQECALLLCASLFRYRATSTLSETENEYARGALVAAKAATGRGGYDAGPKSLIVGMGVVGIAWGVWRMAQE